MQAARGRRYIERIEDLKWLVILLADLHCAMKAEILWAHIACAVRRVKEFWLLCAQGITLTYSVDNGLVGRRCRSDESILVSRQIDIGALRPREAHTDRSGARVVIAKAVVENLLRKIRVGSEWFARVGPCIVG